MTDWIYYLSYLPLFIGFSILLIVSSIALSRNPKNRLNQIFTCISILFIIYLIIYVMDDISAIFYTDLNFSLIYLIALYFLLLVSGFLLLYLLILYKPEIIVKNAYQFVVIMIHVALFLIMFLIPDAVVITRTLSGQLSYPAYSFSFSMYLMLIIIISLLIALLFILKIRKTILEPELKQKFRGIIAGVIVYYFILIRNIICYYIDNTAIRNILEITSISIILAAIILYLTIGKGLKK